MASTRTDNGGSSAKAAHLLTSARAVLFDLDGTLMDTRIDFGFMRREVSRMAAEAGVTPLPEPRADILAMVHQSVERLADSKGPPYAELFRRRVLGRLEEIETEQCAEPCEAPGARDLLVHLKARGTAIGIVTRNARRVSEQILARGGLPFDVLVTRDDVERTKPDPEHLIEALERLSSVCDGSPELRPEEAVMVGDNWMDMQAGRAAGCATIGVLRGRDPTGFETAMPDVLINELSDVIEHIPAAGGRTTDA